MKLRKDNLPWVFDLLTLIAVVIGLTFAGIELRQVRAAQEAQTVLQLFETLKSEDYVKATAIIQSLPYGLSADEIEKQIGAEGMRLYSQLTLTYESLGVMVYRRDISLEWVDEMFRMMVLQTWEKTEPLAQKWREDSGYLGFNEWVQWLAERLRELHDDQPIPAYEAYRDWEP